MGVERMNIKTIKQVPVVFGEADVLRAVLSLAWRHVRRRSQHRV